MAAVLAERSAEIEVRAMQGTYAQPYPYSGQMVVTGAGGSIETIIVLGSINVRLEVDRNGDGTVDNVLDPSWDAI